MVERLLINYRYARVLAVVAHCDDESLFCGGTLRRLADQRCEVHVAVSARVSETNRSSDSTKDDVPRQHRRLVAFGRACGMMGVERTHLLDGKNCSRYVADRTNDDVAGELTAKLTALLADVRPDAVVTHGPAGEYGHPQHALVSQATAAAWGGDLWRFDAGGELRVPVDPEFKRRLLDCYRRGTTQDPHWCPYAEVGSPLAPWLGGEEAFSLRRL